MYIRTSFVCSTLRVSSIRIFILINTIFNNNQDTNRETKTTQTGMTIIKIEIGTTITKTDTGLTTEGDQTNINTTETNTKPKSSSNSQTKM